MADQSFDTSEFIDAFREVGEERLLKLEKGFLEIERSGGSPSLLQELMREAHTLKGEARMLGLTAMSEEAHRLEDLMAALGEGGKDISSVIDTLFEKIAGLRGFIQPAVEEEAKDEETRIEGPKGETVRVKTDLLERISNLSLQSVGAFRQIEINTTRFRRLCKKAKSLEKNWVTVRKNLESCGPRQGSRDIDPEEFEKDLSAFLAEIKAIWRQYELILGLHSDANQELLIDSLASRMRPLSAIFDAYEGQVRRMAGDLGVQINFSVQGGEIEIDKRIIEELNEPLVHLLRNALDHGIESPDARREKGKAAEGRISLKASSRGQHIVITLEDDGNGLDMDAIRERALRAGIVLPEAGADSGEDGEVAQAVLDVLCSAGFTTRSRVSDISGRGVGLSAVKNIAEKFNGSLKIASLPGHGTRFVLQLPLTIAMLPMILIAASGQAVALPSQWVERIVDIRPEEVLRLDGQAHVQVGERLVPVFDLNQALGFTPTAGETRISSAVVIGQNGHWCALRVETLLDQGEFIVKPLPEYLRTRLSIGATIMGDGAVGIILNAPEILNVVHSSTQVQRETPVHVPKGQLKVLAVDDAVITRALLKSLLLRAGYDVTMATNGMDALQKLAASRFDIMLTDVAMPEMDGIELTRRVKGHQTLRDMPVVIFSSKETGEDRMRGMEAGADAYLPKSTFSQQALIETIEQLAEK